MPVACRVLSEMRVTKGFSPPSPAVLPRQQGEDTTTLVFGVV